LTWIENGSKISTESEGRDAGGQDCRSAHVGFHPGLPSHPFLVGDFSRHHPSRRSLRLGIQFSSGLFADLSDCRAASVHSFASAVATSFNEAFQIQWLLQDYAAACG
jgi:hypothetical protein